MFLIRRSFDLALLEKLLLKYIYYPSSVGVTLPLNSFNQYIPEVVKASPFVAVLCELPYSSRWTISCVFMSGVQNAVLWPRQTN